MITQLEIDTYLETQKTFIPRVKELLKSKELTLEYKWDIFLKVASLLPIKSYGDVHDYGVPTKHLSMYDDFYIDRYKTVEFVDLIERIQENQEDAKTIPKYKKWLEIDLNLVKEKILESGLQGFIYDW